MFNEENINNTDPEENQNTDGVTEETSEETFGSTDSTETTEAQTSAYDDNVPGSGLHNDRSYSSQSGSEGGYGYYSANDTNRQNSGYGQYNPSYRQDPQSNYHSGYNQNSGYQNGNYQNGGYQNGNYQNGNYQNGNYQNGNYNGGYNGGNGGYYGGYNGGNNGGNNGNGRGPKKNGNGKRSAVRVIAVIVALALIFGSMGYGFSRLASSRDDNTSQAEISSEENNQDESSKPSDNSQKPDGNDKSESSEESESSESAGNSGKDSSADNSSEESAEEVPSEDIDTGSLSLTYASDSQKELEISEVVEKTENSVVEITTEVVETGSMMQQYITSGAGSGVVLTSDGYIVTNNHVIEDASSITVTLHSGETYDATLVGTDSQQDIALLKIDATGLTPAVVGDSNDLVVGQTIIVVGNPLGQLGGSVTHGIVSGLEREITIENETMNLLQIDAAVNPGNSGGPLFDTYGNLVGIVNAKYSDTDVEGIGFAIPINDALNILGDLKDYGYVRGRVSLGVTLLDIDSDQMAWMYGVNEKGVYLYSVNQGGAADKAGLQAGDRIVAIDGTEVDTVAEVKQVLEAATVGQDMKFTISRNGRQTTINVTVEEYVPSENSQMDSNSQ